MKCAQLITLLFLFSACSDKNTIPEMYTLISTTGILVKNEVAILNGKKYSGYVYQLKNKDTVFISGYLKGRLEGVSKKWYPNNFLKEIRHYTKGEKNGKQVSFWENGNKKFEFIAKKDAYEGELKEWTVDGKLFHLANFKNGQEAGTQKLWYADGKIRANYVIINGKRYGLLGTKNCVNVSDSIFISK
jgi:antitoxin component YwqK of YwqJK toxin-antitoxin module